MSLGEHRIVSVFGSSMVTPESPEYALARRVGQLLAGEGWVVVTGGFGGVMAGTCQGAHEAGGHTVGVTLPLWGVAANPWVREERPQESYLDRLIHVTTRSDAYVALDGGIGTLTELALAWSLLGTHTLPPRPLLAVGRRWRRLMDAFAGELILRPHDLELVTVVDTPEEVIEALKRAWGE